ncbi:hypothetical protein [Microbacterium sp. SORGH_AS_0421]|uniref:hypothetical protein n=2 Tax=Microbacterium TaxID=33882 RepID=UPI00278CE7F0|nr:hypothetical protein [Microbacterium sp. SORGH_AS_0421]MDQ1177781.1 hypothetical protein [Microbacterium sp. SORGH_AS_0421]
MKRTVFALIVAVATVATATSCAAHAAGASGPTPTESITASYACPTMEGVQLPPECAPYDPDAAMAANERYRDRMSIDDDARAAAEDVSADIVAVLRTAAKEKELSAEEVATLLDEGGALSPQVRAEANSVLFAATGPQGGCLFGEVSGTSVSVEIGGYILDGGCLPAQ